MKKIFFLSLVMSALSVPVFAQISQGGTPHSFSRSLNTDVPVIEMPAFDIQRLIEEDEREQNTGEKPFRFAYNHDVEISNKTHGTWETLPNGDKVWRISISSSDAFSLNFGFSTFQLPEGAQLFIYNEDKSYVLGAFTEANHKENGELATTLIHDDFVTLEYFEPVSAKFEGTLIINRVSHGYKSLHKYAKEARGYGDSGSCNMNVNCDDGALWQDEKRSVCLIMSNGSRMCTGALVNNTREDGTPYFLTANHCFSGSVANWVYVFNYEAPGCTNQDGNTNQSVSGSTLRARNADSDFCLTEMSSVPPAEYEPYYAGWDNSGDTPQSAVGIHHPSGDIKKISFDDDPLQSDAGLSSVANSEWKIEEWERATTTEPGSSGSPLWNENHHLIGQLHGGQANCSNSVNDYYGKFDVSWDRGGSSSNQLKDWLDPDDTGVTTIDGYDPNQPTVAIDAQILSISSLSNGLATCDSDHEVIAVLRNKGTSELTSATVTLTIDGNVEATEAWTGSLGTNLTTEINFGTHSFAIGTHDISVTVSSPNGNTDGNENNDEVSIEIEVLDNTATGSAPLADDFESVFPATNWEVENPNANVTFEAFNGAGGFMQSDNCIKMDFYSDGNNIVGQSDYLILPSIEMTSNQVVLISFDLAYAYYSDTYFDSLLVEVTTDCGATWERVWADGKSTLATAGEQADAWTPTTSGDWKTQEVTYSNTSGTNVVKFRFNALSNWGNNLYLDNINLSISNSIETNSSDNITLYPNPTSNWINFNASIQLDQIVIINQIGQSVLTISPNSNAGRIDMSQLEAGIYYIQCFSEAGISIEKIVLK